MKPWVENFFKLTAVTIVAAVLMLLCAFLPDAQVLGVQIDTLLAAIFLNTLLFIAFGLTKKLYGACVLAFIFPVIRFLIMGMYSPLLMIPEVMGGCFMLLVSMIVMRKWPKYQLWGNIGGGVVNFLVRWAFIGLGLCNGTLIKVVMMFENVYDEAGYEIGKQMLLAETANGQWLAGIVGALLATALLPTAIKLIKLK